MSGPVVLLTGRPGVGKTTVVRAVVERLGGKAGGFYTAEVRKGGIRQGFKLVTLDGEEAVMAHVEVPGRPRVSKYGVDVSAIDRVGVPAIERAIQAGGLVVIDEIGPMELYSARFKEAVLRAVESGRPVLATIMRRPNPWADGLKRRPGVRLIEVTMANRDALPEQLVAMFTPGGLAPGAAG